MRAQLDMEGWTTLCSDASWEDYHGMWAKKAKDGTWFVLRWTNMFDACGEEEGLNQYNVEVKSLAPAELPDAERDAALQSCGWAWAARDAETGVGPKITNTYDGAIVAEGDDVEAVLVETCVTYGLGAPLEQFSSPHRPVNLRAKARRFAEACIKDARLHARQLDRVVNAIGSTAREYGRGDVTSAMSRRPTTVQFATLEPNGKLTQVRRIRHADMLRCPFAIMASEHYREDGTCKCDDADERARLIKHAGYKKKSFDNIPLRPG